MIFQYPFSRIVLLNVAVDKTSRKAQKSQKKIRKLIGMMVVRQSGAERQAVGF